MDNKLGVLKGELNATLDDRLESLEGKLNTTMDNKLGALRDELSTDIRKQGVLLETHISEQRDLGPYIRSIYEDIKVMKTDIQELKSTTALHELAIKKQFN